ncbi:MAG: hypothetical protein HC929_00995 [Leptolyngbyaceae cyanobacterium SM2_5_2]|nr:hypothetical protein [Leptolyngbyaceae cyanobacterium SM2_5_2]
MVTVIPLALSEQLQALSIRHQLDLPIPLSSPCASYFPSEQVDAILARLQALRASSGEALAILQALAYYRQQICPPTPCA